MTSEPQRVTLSEARLAEMRRKLADAREAVRRGASGWPLDYLNDCGALLLEMDRLRDTLASAEFVIWFKEGHIKALENTKSTSLASLPPLGAIKSSPVGMAGYANDLAAGWALSFWDHDGNPHFTLSRLDGQYWAPLGVRALWKTLRELKLSEDSGWYPYQKTEYTTALPLPPMDLLAASEAEGEG